MDKKDEINETILCILRHQTNSKDIILDYYPIDDFFKSEIETLLQACVNEKIDLQEISNLLLKHKNLEKLNGYYSYCESLNSSFQGFTIDITKTANDIVQTKNLFIQNAKDNPEKYDLNQHILSYRNELNDKFKVWQKAYSIKIAYRKCYDDKEILTFSHRINGWSNPVYTLSKDFSIELKTNFGYGRASYFYTILKYKEIEITPFSEWIDYEFAKFSEIIRYSQNYILHNRYWLEAMEYARDACNLSLKDETQFILRYIIEECEKMTNGLEAILELKQFTFKRRGAGKYMVDKSGHLLIEFRGEKISGALDFITKIIEFAKITEVKTFVKKIETSNKKIQPILANEAIVIEVELKELKYVLADKTPEYQRVKKENKTYQEKKQALKYELIKTNRLDKNFPNSTILDKEFDKLYPDFKEFQQEYKRITKEYILLKEKIANLEIVLMNILKYNKRIIDYFKNNRA